MAIEDVPGDFRSMLNQAGYSDRDIGLLTAPEVEALVTPLLNTRLDLGEQVSINEGFRPVLSIALDFDAEQVKTVDVNQVVRMVQDAFDALRFRGDDRMLRDNDLADQMAVCPHAVGIVLTNFPHTDIGPRVVSILNARPH